MLYDVAIAGGGPAGLTAGIFLGRYLRSVVLIDSGDPRNWETQGINGFLGAPSVRPAHLRASGRDECRKYGVELVDACVEHVTKLEEERFRVTLESGRRFESRRLLLAYGLRDVWPDIPGLDRCYGETAHVCPDCDGYEARGRHTVVVGTGRKAAAMALALTTWTPHVAVATHGEPPRLDPESAEKLAAQGIPVIDSPVERMHSPADNGGMGRLEFENGSSLVFEQLFFNIGQYPADDLGHQLGCRRDEHDQIVIDEAHHTSVLNVFAAGDVTPGPQLAVRAAAGGAVAALSIHRSLIPAERRIG